MKHRAEEQDRWWHNWLIKEFFDYCRENNYPVDKVYIKEKYWGLRFEPYEWWDDKLRDKIIELENRSHETCQDCWKPWIDRDTWWITTKCDKCYKIYLQSNNKQWKARPLIYINNKK